MRRYTIRQLEYFETAAEFEEFVAAANELRISPPSLTNAVKILEQELGVNLFVRHHRVGITLTSDGKKFLRQVRKVLHEYDKLKIVGSRLKDEVHGQLNVGCLNAIAKIVLPAVRKSYETDYSNVTFYQSIHGHNELIKNLRESNIHVALSFGFNVPTELEFIPLVELPPYAMVYESHPLAHLNVVTMEQLQEHPMVLLDQPQFADYCISLFGQKPESINIFERIKCESLMRSMVANGYGYSISNIKPQNGRSPDGKRLRFIPIGGNVRGLEVGLLFPNGNTRSNLIESFSDHCKLLVEIDGIPGLEIKNGV